MVVFIHQFLKLNLRVIYFWSHSSLSIKWVINRVEWVFNVGICLILWNFLFLFYLLLRFRSIIFIELLLLVIFFYDIFLLEFKVSAINEFACRPRIEFTAAILRACLFSNYYLYVSASHL